MSAPSAPWSNLDHEMQRLRTQEAAPRSPAFRLPAPLCLRRSGSLRRRCRGPVSFATCSAPCSDCAGNSLNWPAPSSLNPSNLAIQSPFHQKPQRPASNLLLPMTNSTSSLPFMAWAPIWRSGHRIRQRDRILVNLTGLDPARVAEIRASLAGLPNISFGDSPTAPANPSSAITEPGQSPPPPIRSRVSSPTAPPGRNSSIARSNRATP